MSRVPQRIVSIAAGMAVAALAATAVFAQANKGTVSEVGEGGRSIAVKLADGKTFKANISGSRTTITVKGQKGERDALKVGMTCSVDAPSDGAEAKAITCD